MIFVNEKIQLDTTSHQDLIDITQKVKDFAKAKKLKNGLLTVSSLHTTAAVVVNENCPNIRLDYLDFVQQWVPVRDDYKHNVHSIDGRPNAHSHLIKFFMNSSETLIVKDGEVVLGTWQSLFFAELDGPRNAREFSVTFVGEIQ